LPAFLCNDGAPASARDIADAFALTGHFLQAYAFAQRGQSLPAARARFIAAVTRESGDIERRPA
jgi:hypothetical protein